MLDLPECGIGEVLRRRPARTLCGNPEWWLDGPESEMDTATPLRHVLSRHRAVRSANTPRICEAMCLSEALSISWLTL